MKTEIDKEPHMRLFVIGRDVISTRHNLVLQIGSECSERVKCVATT